MLSMEVAGELYTPWQTELIDGFIDLTPYFTGYSLLEQCEILVPLPGMRITADFSGL